MDMLPTFIDLCGLEPPAMTFDGMSVAPLLRGEPQELPDREVFVQIRQSTDPPEQWTNAVLCGRWRLIGGRELYDIEADPGQENDVSTEHRGVVERLRAAHEDWWARVEPDLKHYCPISIGADEENPTCLCAMDVLGDVAWHQGHILKAKKSTGSWCVRVEQSGTYRVRLRRWPEELGLPLDATAPPEQADPVPYTADASSERIEPVQARVTVFGRERMVDVEPGAEEATVTMKLGPGETWLDAWFIDATGEERGAYYVYAERL
jgi:hypothetical protein